MKNFVKCVSILIFAMGLILLPASCPDAAVKDKERKDNDANLISLSVAGIDVIIGAPSAELAEAVPSKIFLTETEAKDADIAAAANSPAASVEYGKTASGENAVAWQSSGNLDFSDKDILAVRVRAASGMTLYYKIEIRIMPPKENTAGLLGKVLILQAFGTGSNTDAGASHSFIELYNKSGEAADLSGHSLQYSEGGANWKVLKLDGQTIEAGRSFLILGRKMTNTDPNGIWGLLQLDETHADMLWQDGLNALQMSNRSFKVFLVESSTAATAANPFDIERNGAGIKAEGYIDLLGVNDNDKTASIDAFESAAFGGAKAPYLISKGKSARRIDLTDTDDNGADFEAVEWRQRDGDSAALSAEGFEAFRPRSSKDGAWDPTLYRGQADERNASISELKIGGQTVNPGRPAAMYSAINNPGTVTITDLIADSVPIELTLAPGAAYRTAKAAGSEAPVWGYALSFNFADGDFLYIEVTAKDGMSRQVYKINVSVSQSSNSVIVSGSYALNLNSAIPQQRVDIEAHGNQAGTMLLARAQANMATTGSKGAGTWSLPLPAGQEIWFRVAVTDAENFAFGRVASTSGQSYAGDTGGIELSMGPFAAPELTAFTLIDADANSGVKRNKAGSVNQNTGIISFAPTSFTTVSVNTIINFHALAAVFTVSADSKLYAENAEQVSGVTANDYNKEVVYTVVAGDNARKTYTVAGPQPVPGVNVPGVRSIAGTTSWQTQGFGIMNITTADKTLGMPVNAPGYSQATKLNLVWNPTGTYTYISPEGKALTGETAIKGRGNWTLRMEEHKSYNLKLNEAAGFDYYDYKEGKYVSLPSHKRWALLAHQNDSSRLRAALGFEMGRRVLTDMGWQPHTDWVFFFLNGEYKGLYILSEIIKPDEGRLGIAPAASASNPNGGFVIEINNNYWYANDIVGQNQHFIFEDMYNFMTSHQNPVYRPGQNYAQQGLVFSFKDPDSNLGWHYPDPPEGNGNLTYADTVHFPRKAIALHAKLNNNPIYNNAYNRPSSPAADWIVPNDFGQTNGMGTSGLTVTGNFGQNNGGVFGSRTLSEVYPAYATSAFVKMSKFIQDAEDAVYAHEWGTSGTGGYHDYIDVKSLIDWQIAQEMCSNDEILILNGQYMHFDPKIQKLKMGPLWDLDFGWEPSIDWYSGYDLSPGFVEKSAFWLKEILGWGFTQNFLIAEAAKPEQKDAFYAAELQKRWNEIKGRFNTELNPYIDVQNERFNRITGYVHPNSINGNRLGFKTIISNMVYALDTVFIGY